MAKQNTAPIVSLAEKYLGTPYEWGGNKPGGFDCSGLVQYIYAQAGITLPRVTYDQVNAGTPVDRSDLRAGDIVFFEPSSKGPAHEALYIGDGKIIAAPHRGTNVQVQNLDETANLDGYVGARRVIPDGSPLLGNVAQVAAQSPTVIAGVTSQPSSAQFPADQPPADQPTTAAPAADASSQQQYIPPPTIPGLPTVTPPAASQYPLPGGGLTMPGDVNYSTHGQQVADSWQLLAATPNLHPDTLSLLQIAGGIGGNSQ